MAPHILVVPLELAELVAEEMLVQPIRQLLELPEQSIPVAGVERVAVMLVQPLERVEQAVQAS